MRLHFYVKKIIASIIPAFFILMPLFSQEALKSTQEEYYDFLSLSGIIERPTLGYRTLSDSIWLFNDIDTFEENEDGTFSKLCTPGEESEANIWKNNNLGTTYNLWQPSDSAENWFTRGLKHGLTVRAYGPEWFNSYNTTTPYGQNDGALWQGRGYNTSLTAGVRAEGYGFELTLKPQISFSQNKDYNYETPGYTGENYAGKAESFGYFAPQIIIDAPQRFGDKAFWKFDWGDTEARWSWKTFTIGFGTQAIWLGPSKLNPMLHSNNAPSYPKLDIGLRKTKITMPYFGWDLGSVELRTWIGYLSESNYFDNDDSNNHNMFNGFYFAYEPPALKGLSFGVTKITLSKWNSDENALQYLNPFHSTNTGVGAAFGDDQKASLFASWVIPKGQIEIYGEIGIDDYTPHGFHGLLQYPFDTMIYTVGFSKNVDCIPNNSIYANIRFEWNTFEKNAHRATGINNYTFYSHYQITQGYTNEGQWLGTGFGTGLNSQYLCVNLYYPKGNTKISFQRYNTDNDYAYFKWNTEGKYCYKSHCVLEIVPTYFILDNLHVSCGFTWDYVINPYHKDILTEERTIDNNFRVLLSVAYYL